MNPLNLASTSSPPPVANDLLVKRKRGRPRKDEQENGRVTPNLDVNLVGKTVSGVVAGSYDAGYILNVKVDDSDTKLRGIVFARGKVMPVTPSNDVAPNVKMFTKEETKNQSDDDQSLPPNDETMKDVFTDLEISEPARALPLMSKESNGEAATRLVEFFPAPETKTIVTGQENLILAQKEQEKSPGVGRGFDLMAEEPVCIGEKVPQGLQLQLGNKSILSGDDDNNNNNGTEMETDPKSSVSKTGLIAKLFEGEHKKVDCAMEEEASPSVQ
ncbi:BnaA10g27870D [Brassica napus]|uniref:BnaA10g27870D protein n=1 Tax=Brassica napus TaxID=3708 RepID=A0A078JF46_BRANA|nr:BnaA10g27870D [Brassica napus]